MNLNLQKARLTRLCDGRPLKLEFLPQCDNVGLMILSDDNSKNVSTLFTEEEASLTDEQIKERILIPALNNLDAATFPDRWKRTIDAIKTELRELQNG